MNYKAAMLGAVCFALSAFPSTVRATEKAKMQGAAAATDTVTFSVYLPLQHRDQMEADLEKLHDVNSPLYQKWMTPADFNAKYGPSAAQVKAVQQQLEAYGLKTSVVGTRRIQVSGTAKQVESAFATTLAKGKFSNGKVRMVATAPMVSGGAMAQAGGQIVGLSGMIRMQNHSIHTPQPLNRFASYGGYFFDDLKQAYAYPSYKAFTGKGTEIAVLVPGAYNPSDLDAYFGYEGLKTPTYSEIDVDGGLPFSLNNSFETMLDLEQTGGMAPDSSVVLYNIPDLSDESIIDGLLNIVEDNKADVVNMSFGGAEIYYTPAFNDGQDFTYILQLENDLYAQGNAQGITFVASSGDSGALAAVPLACFSGKPNCGSFFAAANFPASSPHVTGVGGTNLTTVSDGTLNSAYVSEQAYADGLAEDIFYGTSATGGYWGSGGGDSIIFKKPVYQTLVTTNSSYRTVPDLALHMGGCPGGVIGGAAGCDPADSFDYEAIAGGFYGVIGTSASSPDFAGLVALSVQKYGVRQGNMNYYIYALGALQEKGKVNVFRKAIPGFNGKYYTKENGGYNKVLGNGTVEGRNFLLTNKNVAGVPQSPSNP